MREIGRFQMIGMVSTRRKQMSGYAFNSCSELYYKKCQKKEFEMKTTPIFTQSSHRIQ